MSNPIDTSISLAYARFVGRTETILAADRSDAWKVEQTRDALARMDAEIAAIRRLADKPADPMTPRSIYDRWADASSPEAVNVTSMPTEHGTARGESTGTRTLRALLDLPDGIVWDLAQWRCGRCSATGTWTGQDDPAAVNPVTAAADEARRHAADHRRWDAERQARRKARAQKGAAA